MPALQDYYLSILEGTQEEYTSIEEAGDAYDDAPNIDLINDKIHSIQYQNTAVGNCCRYLFYILYW